MRIVWDTKKIVNLCNKIIELKIINCSAEELKFEDNSFDVYTIAFGIRNVPRIDKALSEAFRVLKPGGRIMILEFSKVESSVFNYFY